MHPRQGREAGFLPIYGGLSGYPGQEPEDEASIRRVAGARQERPSCSRKESALTKGDPAAKPKGTVFVRTEVCKGCSYCIDFCPTHALEFSREFNAEGLPLPGAGQPEDCTGCDLCGLYCPDFAIFGVRFKDLEKRRQADRGRQAAAK
ncbi:MAG: 4Fe-4S dicluster domain-containing protein [Rhodopseudomonas palustris]|nr:4Fe-4S dicluster domain-containing protein [Rhodopseudomonas palustris]